MNSSLLKNNLSLFLYTAIASCGTLLDYIIYTLELPEFLNTIYFIISIGLYVYVLFNALNRVPASSSYIKRFGIGMKIASIAAVFTGVFHILLSFIFANYYPTLQEVNTQEFNNSPLDSETIEFAIAMINPYVTGVFIFISMILGGLILSSILSFIVTQRKKDL